MERVSLVCTETARCLAGTERREECLKSRGLWSVGKHLPQLLLAFPKLYSTFQILFFRTVLGRGDLILTVHDGASHQKWLSREQWLGIR